MNLKLESKQDTRWIGLYSKVIVILGVITLATAVAYGALLGFECFSKQTKFEMLIVAVRFFWVIQLAIYGLLACALADLLAYVAGLLPDAAGTRRRKSWLLRHADIGLYLLAGLGLLSNLLFRWHNVQGIVNDHVPWWFILLGSISQLVKAAVLVALGLVVRRALPIIQESRTLV